MVLDTVTIKLGKYARGVEAWRTQAAMYHIAATSLYQNNRNGIALLPAATLAHQAIEMYLKAALIAHGMTIVDPNKIETLSKSGVQLRKSDCAWGHDLVKLGEQLARKEPSFRLKTQLRIPGGDYQHLLPITVRKVLKRFNPYFSEIRYPQEVEQIEEISDESGLLNGMIKHIKLFV
jgi:hypothetical protein